MSVLKNKRSENKLEVYKLAVEIDTLTCRLVMNEKIVPKRWRLVFSKPLMDLTGQLVNVIAIAQIMVPYSNNQVAFRERYQVEAMAILEEIFQSLQRIIYVLKPDINKFQVLCGYLVKEVSTLRAWKLSNKKAKKTLDENVAKAKMKKEGKDSIDSKNQSSDTIPVEEDIKQVIDESNEPASDSEESYLEDKLFIEDPDAYYRSLHPSLVTPEFRQFVDSSKYTKSLKERNPKK